MPPRGRKSQAAASDRSTQSTLSFNQRASKVTKSSLSTPAANKKSISKLNKAAEEEVLDRISEPAITSGHDVAEIKLEPSTTTPQKEDDAEVEPTPKPISRKKKYRTSTGSTASTKEEQISLEAAISSADRITDARVKKYWKTEEDARLAPRINQQSLSMHEKILRHFDLSSQFGPCIGIPRLNRWNRAHTLGLEPPIEVLAVLLKEERKGSDRGEGSRTCGRMAYVDELSGGRPMLVE